MPRRLLVALTVASLALCAATASAAPAASVPTVARGEALHIALATHSRGVCLPLVRYSDGTRQTGEAKKAHAGRLSWALLVARTAPLGAGTWSVRCGAAEVRTGRFVVAGQKGSGETPDLPRVVVDKQGFSQRNDKWGGTGSHVSFGMFLRNASTSQDAMNVYVLVNFVAADGQLIGTMTHNVALVAAGQTFGYGDSMGLRTQVPVAKLELTIRVTEHQTKQTHVAPEFANVRILPNQTEPGWVSEVDGEVLNTAHSVTLKNSHLSIVLVDAAGNPVGGGTGDTYTALPSGSRMVFIASSGFDSVPVDHAVTPIVSVEASYDAA